MGDNLDVFLSSGEPIGYLVGVSVIVGLVALCARWAIAAARSSW